MARDDAVAAVTIDGTEVGNVYDAKTGKRYESPWDNALVTFAFVVSLLVVLTLPAFALV